MSSRGRGVVNSHGRGGQVRDTRQGRATATNQSVTSQSNVTVAPAKQTTRQSRPYQQSMSSRGRTTAAHGPTSQHGMQLRQATSQPASASSQSAAATAENGVSEKDNQCVICMDDISGRPKQLSCGHTFCAACISEYFVRCQQKCPTCGQLMGVLRGNQPDGSFHKSIMSSSLPGYDRHKTIRITYTIPSGIQTVDHPNPGVQFGGTVRVAFLPDSVEGREVCELLRRAFDARLIFTVGRSHTTGLDNVVVWNDIHHKTQTHGQPYGYPDSTYLQRVKADLAAKGIYPPSSNSSRSRGGSTQSTR